MKVVRRYATAARLSEDRPFLQVTGPGGGRLWIVFDRKQDLSSVANSQIKLIRNHKPCGFTVLSSLDYYGEAFEGDIHNG